MTFFRVSFVCFWTLLSTFFFSVSVKAQSCLQQASNTDLIGELNRRLNGSGSGGSACSNSNAVFASFSCGGNSLSFSTSNLNGSTIASSYSLWSNSDASGSECPEFAQSLNQSFRKLCSDQVIEVCYHWGQIYARRYIFKSDGSITQSQFSQNFNTVAECIAHAKTFNYP